MAMTINTNIQSLNAQRNLGASQSSLSTSMQRLSSGMRINSAKDDAAGLSIAERMTSQIRGLNQAQRNANDGVSLAQTAEGALGTIGNNLQRIRELSVQSANATNSASDRTALQKEVTQLTEEIDRVAKTTEFNGTKLLNGDFSAKAFQVGANAGQTITVDKIATATASALGKFEGINLTKQSIGTASDTANAAKVTIGSLPAVDLGSIANDAKAIASAINAAGIAGMSATADETKVAAAATAAVAGTAGQSINYKINGTTITLNETGNATANRSNAAEAINAKSSVTGVRAVDNGSGLELIAADGRNITTATDTTGGGALASFGLGADGTTGATINVTYAAPEGVTGNVVFAGVMGNSSTAIAGSGQSLNAIDISTVDGANQALASVDAALTTINSARAALGAFQNRFESVVSNLSVNSENLSASKSRIMDADFASETANLSRSQILQQAGTAMVAQANQLPQGVLSLLR
ncbi:MULTISPECIES: flagellin [Comamonas]|uniref:flagellin n=1 Tax=Comamonas TaxID=283 RepID=UPI0006224D56|nr:MULTISPECIES: flagellin [Comamonas]KKI13883.1 flagellin [Comamonas thiooxydans]MBP8287477.1 flagellin [Rhodoferax sp.]TYK75075.1 flagellin [Comamonas sp. Z1]BCX50859.1 flagellin [Comamonas testosteroni]